MKKIFKYPLAITDVQKIVVPFGAEPISVHEQDGRLMMWAECDAALKTKSQMTILVIGTGNPIPEHYEREFIGTVPMSNGLVWHVFQGIEK